MSSIRLKNKDVDFTKAAEEEVLRILKKEEQNIDNIISSYDSLSDEDYRKIRQQRLQELKKNSEIKKNFVDNHHLQYTELFDEKEFFEAAKKSNLMVLHFYRTSNRHCEVVDHHMIKLSKKYISTRFVKINAEKVPYLTERLKIWMLPTIMLISNQKTEHSIVGLDELGGENFTSEDLEKILAKWKVIEKSDS